MSSGERCLHHSKLNHSLDRSNYQILCDLSVQIICVPITTQDIQFLSAFLVFFFALLVWFIVVGTNMVNHYRYEADLSVSVVSFISTYQTHSPLRLTSAGFSMSISNTFTASTDFSRFFHDYIKYTHRFD